MALAVFLFLTVTLSSVHFGVLAETLIRVECQPAVGLIGLTTKIFCSFKTSFGTDQKITIYGVGITRRGQEDSLFTLYNDEEHGDTRVKLPSRNDPSLLIIDTAVSDEGQYDYTVMTNRGIVQDGTFKISITAKYNQLTLSSWPEQIEDGGSVDLYCNASGGYPAGAIHWFDNTGTNWTKDATLEITEGEDKLLKLSSKLSFTKFDSLWAPFRCEVLNSKFTREDENVLKPVIVVTSDKKHLSSGVVDVKFETKVVAPVVVIGSLIVGLLLVLVLCRTRNRRGFRENGLESDPEVKGLAEKQQNKDNMGEHL